MASAGCGFDLIRKRGWMVMVSRFSLELDNPPGLVIAATLSSLTNALNRSLSGQNTSIILRPRQV